MIRLIRVFSVLLCIISTALFVFSGIYTQRGSDSNGPEIHMETSEIEVSIKATEAELLEGVTAKDEKDGDVTESLMVESMGLFVEKGKRKIVIDAFDSNHNISRTERVIKYTDYVSPKIILEGPLRAPLNDIDTLVDVIKVEDCLEGDITENLQITLLEDMTGIAAAGEYGMKLTVANAVGDVIEIPATVELYEYSRDSSVPKVTLTDYLIYSKVGQEIDPQAYLKGVTIRGSEYEWTETEAQGLVIPYTKRQIDIENNVDIETPGVYEIVYSLDANGETSKIRLVVIVEE